MLIDEAGEQLGVQPLRGALEKAWDMGLDLVEVAPQLDPPVCRILDYGRFRYVQERKQREARRGSRTGVLREVRLRPRIGEHDIRAKLGQVKRLLAEGNKVRLSVRFRGREITHPELGMVLLRECTERLKEVSKLEKAPSMEGRFLAVILIPTVRELKKNSQKTDVDDPMEESSTAIEDETSSGDVQTVVSDQAEENSAETEDENSSGGVQTV